MRLLMITAAFALVAGASSARAQLCMEQYCSGPPDDHECHCKRALLPNGQMITNPDLDVEKMSNAGLCFLAKYKASSKLLPADAEIARRNLDCSKITVQQKK